MQTFLLHKCFCITLNNPLIESVTIHNNDDFMDKPDIRAIFRNFDSNKESLTQYQIDFINGIKRYYRRNKTLTERQQEVLMNIAGHFSSVNK
jgi:hypothetical protein